MVTTARAALSVVLLLGFYVYAFGVVVAFGALTVLLANYVQGAVIGKLAIVTLLMAGGICYATWKVIRTRPSPMPGWSCPSTGLPICGERFGRSPGPLPPARPTRFGWSRRPTRRSPRTPGYWAW